MAYNTAMKIFDRLYLSRHPDTLLEFGNTLKRDQENNPDSYKMIEERALGYATFERKLADNVVVRIDTKGPDDFYLVIRKNDQILFHLSAHTNQWATGLHLDDEKLGPNPNIDNVVPPLFYFDTTKTENGLPMPVRLAQLEGPLMPWQAAKLIARESSQVNPTPVVEHPKLD